MVIGVYGTTLLFGLVPTDGISWQGHLFGGVGGVIAARMLDRRQLHAAAAKRMGVVVNCIYCGGADDSTSRRGHK